MDLLTLFYWVVSSRQPLKCSSGYRPHSLVGPLIGPAKIGESHQIPGVGQIGAPAAAPNPNPLQQPAIPGHHVPLPAPLLQQQGHQLPGVGGQIGAPAPAQNLQHLHGFVGHIGVPAPDQNIFQLPGVVGLVGAPAPAPHQITYRDVGQEANQVDVKATYLGREAESQIRREAQFLRDLNAKKSARAAAIGAEVDMMFELGADENEEIDAGLVPANAVIGGLAGVNGGLANIIHQI